MKALESSSPFNSNPEMPIELQVGIRHSIRLGSLAFSRDDLSAIAGALVDSERYRIARGINVNDHPAKPLSAAYEKQKLRAGARPIRDLRLSGLTMSSFGVLEISEGRAVIGFSGAEANKRAAINQTIEPMVGISPNDAQAARREAHLRFAANVRGLIGVSSYVGLAFAGIAAAIQRSQIAPGPAQISGPGSVSIRSAPRVTFGYNQQRLLQAPQQHRFLPAPVSDYLINRDTNREQARRDAAFWGTKPQY
jgi:hypothetical protein